MIRVKLTYFEGVQEKVLSVVEMSLEMWQDGAVVAELSSQR